MYFMKQHDFQYICKEDRSPLQSTHLQYNITSFELLYCTFLSNHIIFTLNHLLEAFFYY